jgi:hypothetical protein
MQAIIKYPHKIVSLFEPHTEIIRKGRASKPNKFGNLVKVQEAENQIEALAPWFVAPPAAPARPSFPGSPAIVSVALAGAEEDAHFLQHSLRLMHNLSR